MRRNVVLKDLARRAASAIALSLLMLAPAVAAERANINFIGYDPDANYFAFEEYGENDGSGAYYDHIYVIDLGNDSWVKGTPILVDDEDDDSATSLIAFRQKALQKAAPILKQHKIDAPVSVLALIGDGSVSDRQMITWQTPNCCGIDSQEDTKFSLLLTPMPIAKADAGDCGDFVDQGLVGFTLSYTDGTTKSELHSDGATLPKSRGCSLGYGIYAVIDNMLFGGGRVAIIESWVPGFEGPDRRFIAVPIDGHI
jgi:predicted secreted protein